jgi:hypothetical protein
MLVVYAPKSRKSYGKQPSLNLHDLEYHLQPLPFCHGIPKLPKLVSGSFLHDDVFGTNWVLVGSGICEDMRYWNTM